MENKVNRRRNVAVTIRMTQQEYNLLQEKITDSGLSQQSFILNAIRETVIKPSDEIAVQKEISKTFADLVRQIRGLSTNVNQMAHIANGQGFLPEAQQLANASKQLDEYRKESEEIWRLIRLSINQQNHTVPCEMSSNMS